MGEGMGGLRDGGMGEVIDKEMGEGMNEGNSGRLDKTV